ncbi:M56 family metallopeptidase [Bacteroides acidifaciens]|uniref:M56 family metallopeptidase n=1 Tax=Bacteroides acidifaciens TaxID=85831 RepID=UPI0015895044|nr:M56 family metallopeptidase [Bacteroides acidifaciens]
MGAFFIYILKSSVCLVLFYLLFRLLLSKETFHRFNRVALLGVLFLSLLIPFIEVTTNHQVEVQQTVLTIEQLLMMAEMESTAVDAAGVAVNETASFSWIEIVLFVYLAGIILLACRNLYSLFCLFRLIHSGKREKLENGITLVVHEQEIAPFSWMKYIVISQKDQKENGREILIHEAAHIRHRHSIDLLLADICIFFQWFNPGAWLLKQELQNIHEYEADETVINEGVNAKEYQLLLIKKAVGTRLYSMANSFNHSKLKKRITMMLKEKSNPWARLKYLYVLPLAAIAVTAFARPEVSEKVEEISAVKVNDLAETVETKTEENDVKAPVDTTKTDVVVVAGYRKEEKDSLFRFKRNGMSVSMTKTSPKETPLIIINGKESDMTVVNALDPKRIKSISVADAKDAMKNYGERGKGGVMDIQLYSEEKFQSTKVVLKPDVSKKLDALNGNTKNWGVHFRSANGGDPLVIIDGKEVLGEDPLSKISPDRIRSISVLKDKSAQAIYGDKGKSGVILIDMLTDEEYQIRQNKVIVVGKSSKDTITLKADSITIIPNK